MLILPEFLILYDIVHDIMPSIVPVTLQQLRFTKWLDGSKLAIRIVLRLSAGKLVTAGEQLYFPLAGP